MLVCFISSDLKLFHHFLALETGFLLSAPSPLGVHWGCLELLP